jgi:chromate reductase
MQILGIAGSLREGSYNRGLLAAAAELAPEGMEIRIWDRMGEVAPYDADLDTDERRPEPVRDLKERISLANGVLVATPEYNYSFPGLLKNAIDWASRPGYHSVLRGKPVALIGASASMTGTARAQTHLREVFYATMSHVFPHAGVAVAQAASKYQDGRLTDEATRKFLKEFLKEFQEYARSCAG